MTDIHNLEEWIIVTILDSNSFLLQVIYDPIFYVQIKILYDDNEKVFKIMYI